MVSIRWYLGCLKGYLGGAGIGYPSYKFGAQVQAVTISLMSLQVELQDDDKDPP